MSPRSCKGGVVCGVAMAELGGIYHRRLDWGMGCLGRHRIVRWIRTGLGALYKRRKTRLIYGEVDYINELLPTARACYSVTGVLFSKQRTEWHRFASGSICLAVVLFTVMMQLVPPRDVTNRRRPCIIGPGGIRLLPGLHTLSGGRSRSTSLGSRGRGGGGDSGNRRGGTGRPAGGRVGNHIVLLVVLLLPLGGPRPLGLAPRAHVAELATAGALALSAKGLGQVLGRHLLEQVLLVRAAQDVDLLHRDGVEPGLNHVPHAAEAPGRVDQVQAAEALGVVVLAERADLLDVAKDRGRLHEADALEVHDAAASLEEVAALAAARREARVGEALVFDGEVRQHALLGRDLGHGGEVDGAELLDVDGAAILRVLGLATSATQRSAR